MKDVLALFQVAAEGFHRLIRVDLLGLWHHACTHFCIKILRAHLRLVSRSIGNPVDGIIQRKHADLIFLYKALRQICRILGGDYIFCHDSCSLIPKVFF